MLIKKSKLKLSLQLFYKVKDLIFHLRPQPVLGATTKVWSPTKPTISISNSFLQLPFDNIHVNVFC